LLPKSSQDGIDMIASSRGFMAIDEGPPRATLHRRGHGDLGGSIVG
jgi:hypothetical protein